MKRTFLKTATTTVLALGFTLSPTFSMADEIEPTIISAEQSETHISTQNTLESGSPAELVTHSESSILDNANVFSSREETQLEESFQEIQRDYNIVVAVETVEQAPGEDIQSYTTNRHNELGIGDRRYDNGMFFVIAIEDREYFVTLGDGLTEVSESELKEILDNTLPDAFRSGNYAQGIIHSAESYAKGETGQSESMFSEFLPFAGFAALFSGSVFLSKRQKSRNPVYPSKNHKQKILSKNSEIYQQLITKNARHAFEQEQGLKARRNYLQEHGIIKKREAYSEYADRALIDKHYGIWTYNKQDSIEIMKARYEEFIRARDAGELTPEELYSTLSTEEKIDFQDGKLRQDILGHRGYNYSQGNAFQLERQMLGFMTADRAIRNYRRSQHSNHSTRGSSRGGGRTSGRGAGGRW